ncbi:MAG: aminomethyl-transferring glycine dehydrogenase subunit GcvPA, partial [bacterium]|nr:aminomethyl-transferring glycine dehydrogenase subunit GcvPA [bacterium]
MANIPNDGKTVEEMLASLGVSSVNELFSPIPPELQEYDVDLPLSLSEQETVSLLSAMADENKHSGLSFLGASCYDHYIPAALPRLLERSEFETAYTPYQPEISQGTLTLIFEFQSYVAALTGMEVGNASMYDGATAAAEAALMAMRLTKRNKSLVAGDVHPEYRQTIDTYLRYLPDASAQEIPLDNSGILDIGSLKAVLNDEIACVVVSYPNFFGIVDGRMPTIAHLIKEAGAKLVVVANPMALTVLSPPGEWGADIVVGEGQPFGIPMSFGGPGVGFFAAKMGDVRQMPGRIVGKTTDADGNPGYCLTLQTREQHIRREKATSNICSNQALCAAAFTVYCSLLGERGLRKTGELNLAKAGYAKKAIVELPGYELAFPGSTFNEFAVRCPKSAVDIRDAARAKAVDPGLDLGRFYPDIDDCLL